jgi:2-keto-3-deoxy-L-arabinonate dehydratase
MKTKSGFYGVYPVAFALFGEDGNLHRESVRKQVEAMVRHNVHGIAVLGLASEVNKLSLRERHQLMEWVIEDAAGRVPVSVTIAEANIAEQIAFAHAAKAAGASWLILQPPPVRGIHESALIRFFGAVAEKSDLQLAIQNAPEYLGIGLSNEGVAALNRLHPNVSIIKMEATSLAIDRLQQVVGGNVDIFNGRAGIDMLEVLRAGAVGFIPGGESYDFLTSAYRNLTENGGDRNLGESQYLKTLPLLSFLMESIDSYLVYGKIVLGQRLDITHTNPREPFGTASQFGKEVVGRFATSLGRL